MYGPSGSDHEHPLDKRPRHQVASSSSSSFFRQHHVPQPALSEMSRAPYGSLVQGGAVAAGLHEPLKLEEVLLRPGDGLLNVEELFGDFFQKTSTSTLNGTNSTSTMTTTTPSASLIAQYPDGTAAAPRSFMHVSRQDGQHLKPRWIPEEEAAEDYRSTSRRKISAKERKALLNSMGEHRLKINFSTFGEIGNEMQFIKFRGGKQAIIPDGISGVTESYGEPWQITIRHRRIDGFSRTVVEWTLKNLNSNRATVRIETEEEAIARETQAKTVCNQLMKDSMDQRVLELQMELQHLPPNRRVEAMQLENRIRTLQPKRVLVGPLLFGLQHQCVQEKMKEKLEQLKDGNRVPDNHMQ